MKKIFLNYVVRFERERMLKNFLVKKRIFYIFFYLFLFLLCITACDLFSFKTLDYKIAQMIMIGFSGTKINEESVIYNDIKDEHVGAILLYTDQSMASIQRVRTKEQIKKLCTDIKKINKNIFIAIDEEGGIVSRLNSKYGFRDTKTAKEVAAFNNGHKIKHWANRTIRKLNYVGINFNLAPVVDLDIGGNSPAIHGKKRCFSNDPKIVSKYAKIFIREHRKNHIMTAIKHFPGYGSIFADPHQSTTNVTNTWQEKELEPFEFLIKNNMVDAVMTAHIFNKKLDQKYPATLSKTIIDGILRKKLNFNGVVISDDLFMGAITNKYSFKQAVILAINAGVDILIFSKNISPNQDYKSFVEYIKSVIKDAVKDGDIPKERINQSYERIVKLKEKINLK